MNILYGFYQPDEGEICIQDQPVKMTSPHDAIKKALAWFTSTSCWCHRSPSGTRALGELAILDLRAVARRVRDLSRQYTIEVDPDAVVRNLIVGAQQRVEITKALYQDADILILDEPTAVLTPQEADELFVIMHNLIRGGIVGSCSEPRGGGTSLEQGSCEPNPAADRNMVIAGFDRLISATYEDK
jgi:simple sugar transport system ATP-binding protein